MADLQFPWEAFIQAQQAKNQNQQKMMEMFGSTLANVGQNVGAGLKTRRERQAQTQFGQALTNAGQPVQGPPTQTGQAPVQPPVNVGQLTTLFSKAYPQQANPFAEGMAKKIFPSPETQFQQEELKLKQKGLELEEKKNNIQALQEQARLLETQGYHKESAELRRLAIDSTNNYREDMNQLRALIFNARQGQGADTKNMGFGGLLRSLFNLGVEPSKVAVPGGDEKDNARKMLGLQ